MLWRQYPQMTAPEGGYPGDAAAEVVWEVEEAVEDVDADEVPAAGALASVVEK